MKIRTLTAVTTTVPVVDEKGKAVPKVEVEFNGRKQMVDVHDHVRHGAHAIVDLPEAVAKELIARGAASPVDDILDDSLEDPANGDDGV